MAIVAALAFSEERRPGFKYSVGSFHMDNAAFVGAHVYVADRCDSAGDTVNTGTPFGILTNSLKLSLFFFTASRMESTGQAGRIQVSESTAKELQAKRKDHWLVPREDVIVAKGKGELQTYWLNITSGAASSSGGVEE